MDLARCSVSVGKSKQLLSKRKLKRNQTRICLLNQLIPMIWMETSTFQMKKMVPTVDKSSKPCEVKSVGRNQNQSPSPRLQLNPNAKNSNRNSIQMSSKSQWIASKTRVRLQLVMQRFARRVKVYSASIARLLRKMSSRSGRVSIATRGTKS